MVRQLLRPLVFAGLAVLLGGCPSIGAGRALDEAKLAIAEVALVSNLHAPARARFDWFQAQAFLAEAETRAGHGDWAQSESWAVRARKAAEAAKRRVLGETP